MVNAKHLFSALVIVFLARDGAANRQILQTIQGVPTFQGTGLTVVNSADPAAQQTSAGTSVVSADSLAPTPATILPAIAASVPSSQPPAAVLPTVQVPAPQVQPQSPPQLAPQVLPVVTVPAPQPSAASPPPPPKPVAPAPAPTTPVVPPAVPVPVPAPQVPPPIPAPVPAPAPVAPPLCGVEPQCRVFVEDMLCCGNAGAVSNQQHAVMRLQCTHPVNYQPKCAKLVGPTNTSAFNQFDTDVWSASHQVQINYLTPFYGNITVDVEGPRVDANLSADCGLYITPCYYNGVLVSQVAPVQSLSFSTLPNEEFLEVTYSASTDVTLLDNLVMSLPGSPYTCQQQNLTQLDSTFFSTTWVNYTSGFQDTCNITAYEAAMSPVALNAAAAETATLG